MFTTGLTQPQILANIQAVLRQHRDALEACADLYAWFSGLSTTDLTSIGFSAADAATVLSALSDAHAEYLVHTTGQPPASYPQAASAYVYSASQTQVIGPQ